MIHAYQPFIRLIQHSKCISRPDTAVSAIYQPNTRITPTGHISLIHEESRGRAQLDATVLRSARMSLLPSPGPSGARGANRGAR